MSQDEEARRDEPAEADDAGGSATREEDRTAEDRPADRGGAAASTPFTQQVGRVVLALLIAIFGALAFANVDPVAIDLIFGRFEIRLFVLIVLTFAAGLVSGLLIGWRRHRQRHRAP